MSRLQLALNVADIDEAVAFYSAYFDTVPAKRRPGYANFVVADPPLKLVLFENPDETGTLNHLGVERGSTREVESEAFRLAAAGLALRVEDGVVCCHARQDKHWVTGPDGQEWENYVVLADVRGVSGRVTAVDLARQAFAELLGTAGLVAVVVGSGIAAQRLSTDPGLRLLENALVTGAGLVALLLALGPVSGAHLNPVVTLADRVLGGITSRQVAAYVPAQLVGGALGAIAANLMFGGTAVSIAGRHRGGAGLVLSEVLATFGLVVLVFALARSGRGQHAPYAVGAYIAAAYWWSSSTSFANPAVTVARTLSDSFAGIAPSSVPWFVVAQLLGGAAAVAAVLVLYPTRATEQPR